MRFLKSIFWSLVVVLVSANLAIIISGKTYLYKGVVNTYLVGKTGPTIHDLEVFPVREISAGHPQPWSKHSNYNERELRSEQEDRLRRIGSVSYLIIKKDSLYFEKYWEDHGPDSVTNSFSVAKSIVSALTGIAIREGKIESLDQKVGDFLPSFQEGRKKELRIRHLLTMSSGTNWVESGGDPFSHNARAYYGDDLEGLIKELKIVEEPGKRFNYQSGNTQIMSFVLEKATGMKVGKYAQLKLWQEIGATHEAWWSLDRTEGDEKAYCCFYATPRDFARLGQLYLDGGSWNGNRIVPENYVKKSIQPAELVDNAGNPIDHYGYFWWLEEHEGLNIFYARGILGQYIIAIPEKDMVIVRTGHQRLRRKDGFHPEDLYLYLEVALDLTS